MVVLLAVVWLSSDNGSDGTDVDLKGNKFTYAILTHEYENIKEVNSLLLLVVLDKWFMKKTETCFKN